ncbi:hypothetical protein H0H87_000031 [Tephrocybe sp. NHM501043]|nr:hypothetical protein H0H87_000031 [Tephrocybe sp. NHM501043]
MIFLSGRVSRTPARPTDIADLPSLACLCLHVLARYPDQLPVDARRPYDPAVSDVLDGAKRNPAYWAALVQFYDNLPDDLATLCIPLADSDVPLLQRIQQTPLFSLLTILDLPGCPHLTDTSIVNLSPLHSLVALDASKTSLSSYAIKSLAGTLLWIDDGPLRRGPWPLRILRLRFCSSIDNTVYPHLDKFPLLTAIDLRGTDCRPPKNRPFKSCRTRPELFHPEPLVAAVDALEGTDLYTSKDAFKLVIDTLDHPQLPVDRESNTFGSTYTFGPPPQVRVEQCEHKHINGSKSAPPCPSILHIPAMRAPETNSIIPNFIIPGIASEIKPNRFYSFDRRRVPSNDYDPINNYNAKSYYKWVHLEAIAKPSSHLDLKLTLYRTPPPWSALEQRSTFLLNQARDRPPTGDKFVAHVAPFNRTQNAFQINQSRIDALRESASARRRSGMGIVASSLTSTAPKDEAPEPLQSRNPFRRHSIPDIIPYMSPLGSGNGMKTFKRISSVEVPVLSPSLKTGLNPSAIANTPPARSNLSMGPSVNKVRSGAFDSTGPSHRSITSEKKRKRPRSLERVVVKKPCVEDRSATDTDATKKGAVEVSKKKGFDWNSWRVR